MTETKFTPGPWKLGNTHDCGDGYAICAGSRVLARIVGFGYPTGKGKHPESDGNAQIMRAAPQLYAALEDAADTLLSAFGQLADPWNLHGWNDAETFESWKDIRAVLAEPRGE